MTASDSASSPNSVSARARPGRGAALEQRRQLVAAPARAAPGSARAGCSSGSCLRTNSSYSTPSSSSLASRHAPHLLRAARHDADPVGRAARGAQRAEQRRRAGHRALVVRLLERGLHEIARRCRTRSAGRSCRGPSGRCAALAVASTHQPCRCSCRRRVSNSAIFCAIYRAAPRRLPPVGQSPRSPDALCASSSVASRPARSVSRIEPVHPCRSSCRRRVSHFAIFCADHGLAFGASPTGKPAGSRRAGASSSWAFGVLPEWSRASTHQPCRCSCRRRVSNSAIFCSIRW